MLDDEKIRDIAGELDLGLKCFIHITDGTLVSFPDELNYDDVDPEVWGDTMKLVEENPDDYIEIEKMDSHQAFKVMEDFIETVDNQRLRDKLFQALDGTKPFKNFKFQVDNSGSYREQWFKFKNQKSIEWVKEQLSASGL